MTYQKGWRTVYSLSAHVVLVTKYRRNVINNEILSRWKDIFADTLKKWDAELVEFNGGSCSLTDKLSSAYSAFKVNC